MGKALPSVSRRDFFRASAAGGSVAALHPAGLAQPAGQKSDTGAEFITPDTQAAIDRGLAHLAQGQGADGSFADRHGGTVAGITGLGGLALMSAGHQPGRGKY